MFTSDLLTTLENYQPWNGTEATHYAAILDLLRSNPAAFDRHSYQPGHITGSTWILAEDTGQVAMIYHRRLDRWLLLGGHADVGETDSISTALQEAREELGLVLDSAKANLFDLDYGLGFKDVFNQNTEMLTRRWFQGSLSLLPNKSSRVTNLRGLLILD